MRLIHYFIKNRSLNYVLLFFILFLGINAYYNIPKELFPEIALDKISIRGAYPGSSADNLDKMAVRDIEDELGNIQGIDKIETIIKSGSFSILLYLNEGSNQVDALNKAKDAIARSRQYLPADMTEPTAEILTHNRPLIRLSLSSADMDQGQLIETAKDVKSKLSRNPYVSEIQIYGDADQEVSVQINEDAVRAYGLNPFDIINAVSTTSYIYPIGDIKQSGNYIFLSTVNGKANKEEWENTLIKIGEIQVRLGDIAKVDITYPQNTTLSTFNGRSSITLVISK